MSATLVPGLTVVGNLAIDRVDGGPPSPGGCPSFAGLAFARMREREPALGQRIITKCAPADAALFSALTAASAVPTTLLAAPVTAAFALDYDGEDRAMTVVAVGDPWTPAQLAGAAITTTWVHAAPLLRDELPVETLTALRAAGHRLSLDGQGLVRAPRRGAMLVNDAYDPALLDQLDVLKLAGDEAAVVAGGEFTSATATSLGVPEILVTFGSGGVDLYLDGRREHAAPRQRVSGVHTTGSGDIFAVAYAAARAGGTETLAAVDAACQLVADVLERRRRRGGTS